ncbi:TetR/AcrR family transcriptional regulator [Streptomyces mesophilus]|uniref:TetR/AcrR family transcriptional regulator n=1 Tax=Streptomyces mesophilus TaxID=1775132 RepID=UPI00332FAFCB
MRSVGEDRTGRAVIRDEALRLFAARGTERVTVRQVAAAAGASPALVMHHFGSKDGLRDAVDQHVVATVEELIAQLARAAPADALLRQLPPDSPVPEYLGRLLVEDSAAGQRLFERLLGASRDALQVMVAEGTASSGDDPSVRAAFLLVNDLAVLLLRNRLIHALDLDPLSADGLTRWTGEVANIYAEGLGGRSSSP